MSPRARSPSFQSLKIFKNGKPGDPHMFPYKNDLRHARTWTAVLDMLGASMTMSTKGKRSGQLTFDIGTVFSLEGKEITCLSELVRCTEVVVCGRKETYQYAQYGCPVSADDISDPDDDGLYRVGRRSSKVRRQANNSTFVKPKKSVCFELPPTATTEEEGDSYSHSRQSYSEMDVSRCRLEVASLSEAESVSLMSKARRSSDHSLKSRPSSARVSRIPRRIIREHNNSIIEGVASSHKMVPKSKSATPSSTSVVDAATSAISIPEESRSRTPNPEQLKTPENRISTAERHNRLGIATSLTRGYIRPRLVTVVRHGRKPRRAVRFLLNRKTANSFDQVLTDITRSIKPDWGAVRRVYNLNNGNEVASLEEFFGNDDIFLACPNNQVTSEDFELDYEECKAFQPYVKGKLTYKSARGPPRSDTKSPRRKSVKTGVVSSPSSTNVDSPRPATGSPSSSTLSHFPKLVMDDYEVGRIIGDGNFAVVRECTAHKSRRRFALKVIDKSKFTGKGLPAPDQEIKILAGVRHPNIVVLYEHYDFPDEFYLVMELVEGGDLFDSIAKVSRFSEMDSKSMTKDVASALQYLHSKSIVHRDVKPENLLINYHENGCRHIKLGDFGLAQVMTGPMLTICGTPTYVAPEILAETGYGLQVDMWALGVIVYVLLSGYPPFYSQNGDQQELFNLILAGEFDFQMSVWSGVSKRAKDIIHRMMERNPERRLTAEQVLQHDWLMERPALKREEAMIRKSSSGTLH